MSAAIGILACAALFALFVALRPRGCSGGSCGMCVARACERREQGGKSQTDAGAEAGEALPREVRE